MIFDAKNFIKMISAFDEKFDEKRFGEIKASNAIVQVVSETGEYDSNSNIIQIVGSGFFYGDHDFVITYNVANRDKNRSPLVRVRENSNQHMFNDIQ